MGILQHDGKLMGILDHPANNDFKLSEKAHAQACPLRFVPILNVEDLGARHRRKDELHLLGAAPD